MRGSYSTGEAQFASSISTFIISSCVAHSCPISHWAPKHPLSYCPLPPFKLHRRNRVEHPRGSSYKLGQLGVWWNAPCRDAAWGDAVNRRKRRSTFTHSLRGTTAAPFVNMFLLVSVCCLNAVDTRYNFSLHRWFLRCFVLPHHPGSAHLTQGMVVLMFQPHRRRLCSPSARSNDGHRTWSWLVLHVSGQITRLHMQTSWNYMNARGIHGLFDHQTNSLRAYLRHTFCISCFIFNLKVMLSKNPSRCLTCIMDPAKLAADESSENPPFDSNVGESNPHSSWKREMWKSNCPLPLQ